MWHDSLMALTDYNVSATVYLFISNHYAVIVCLSGNGYVHVIIVTLHCAELVCRWHTIMKSKPEGQLSLAIPYRLRVMSTGSGHTHRYKNWSSNPGRSADVSAGWLSCIRSSTSMWQCSQTNWTSCWMIGQSEELWRNRNSKYHAAGQPNTKNRLHHELSQNGTLFLMPSRQPLRYLRLEASWLRRRCHYVDSAHSSSPWYPMESGNYSPDPDCLERNVIFISAVDPLSRLLNYPRGWAVNKGLYCIWENLIVICSEN